MNDWLDGLYWALYVALALFYLEQAKALTTSFRHWVGLILFLFLPPRMQAVLLAGLLLWAIRDFKEQRLKDMAEAKALEARILQWGPRKV